MQTALKQELIAVLKGFPIKKASLFGSFARGEDTPNSDIDILIEPDAAVSVFDLLRIEEALGKKFSRKIDLVEFAALKPSIRAKVLGQAIPLI